MTKVHNIFTFLGLKEDHRPAVKIAQLPRHMDEISVKANKEGEFYVDNKYDGNHCVIVKSGKSIGFFSRVGKEFTNVSHLSDLIKLKKMDDGVYFSELYCDRAVMPMQKFQALHGSNRKAALTEAQERVMKEEAKLAFFDYIPLKAFIGDKAGIAKDERPMSERRAKLEKAIKKFSTTARIHHVRYVMASSEEEIREIAKERIKQGEEGIVAKGVHLPYVCGHKNFHFIKIVKKITFDLKCIGYKEGTNGKRVGTLDTLQFSYGKDGEHTISADLGKGYDDKIRLAMLKACKKGKKDSPVGKVFEVYALEKIGLKNLRQPKVGKLREDKEGQEDKPETLTPNKKESKVAKKDKKVKKEKAPKESVEQTKKGKKNKKADEPKKGKKEKAPKESPKKEKKVKKGKKAKK